MPGNITANEALVNSYSALEQAIRTLVSDGIALASYAINDVATPSATLTYVGRTDKVGAWLVQRIDASSGVVIRYATVTNNSSITTYASAWDGRVALVYSVYDEAF